MKGEINPSQYTVDLKVRREASSSTTKRIHQQGALNARHHPNMPPSAAKQQLLGKARYTGHVKLFWCLYDDKKNC